MSPAIGKQVRIGINALYFEMWDILPPPMDASFLCSECKQTHQFDNTNTWTQD